jgi:myo-inositol 2-dehydrogenase/D-chiro-inositol 1-dehydrogenase
MRRVNVGLIGAGRIGRMHANHLAHRRPHINLAAVADVRPQAAEELAAELELPRAFGDHRALLDDTTIEAVLVCSSTDTHARMIEEAAAAGKHVFCEKPLALDLASIDKALEAVDKAGVKLQVGFNRRFNRNYRRVREIIASGQLGRPHLLRMNSMDPEPPPMAYVEVSGGMFLDLAVHDLDLARYLIGSEVDEIFAAGSVLIDPRIGELGDVDTATITLRFANGVLGTIDNSRRGASGEDRRVEVFGSEGVATVPNVATQQVVHHDVSGVQLASTDAVRWHLDRDAYTAELRTFVECIVEDTTPPVSGLDGRIATLMAIAAQRSCEENRPIELSEVDTNRR